MKIKDVIEYVVATTCGIIAFVIGYRMFWWLDAVEVFPNTWKCFFVQLGAFLSLGWILTGMVLLFLAISLIYQDLTGKRPWWLP